MKKESEGERSVADIVATLNGLVERFERFAVSWSIIIMASVSIINVIGRNVFQHSFTWAEEVTQFAIVWVTFIGISYAARLGAHIRMTALFDVLPKKGRKVLMIVISAGTAALMFFIAWYALQYTLSLYAIQRRTLGLRIPLYLIIMWVPIGFVSAGLQYVQTLFMNIVSSDVYVSPTLIDEEEDEVSQQFEL
jgi:TRAP-type C4-dicarboxylate transport system permease small subunit